MTPEDVRARLRDLELTPRRRTREFAELEKTFGKLRPAAVLAPLTERDGRFEVVVTKRAETLRKHAGQFSFPGGRKDPTDTDLLYTALRETHEEIAIRPDDVSVFGALMSMPTVTSYDVTMFVGEFESPYELVGNPAEIDTIVHIPLNLLPQIHRTEPAQWNGHEFEMHFFEYGEHVVWGATAYMLHCMLQFLRMA